MNPQKIHCLNKLLADTYTLCMKAQYYHWNVRGCGFLTFHKFTEEQYEELFAAVDEIAEHHLMIGHEAPGGFGAYQKVTTVSENKKDSGVCEGVKDLQGAHQEVLKCAEELLQSSQKDGDDFTADLAMGRVKVHKKYIWLMSSMLSDK